MKSNWIYVTLLGIMFCFCPVLLNTSFCEPQKSDGKMIIGDTEDVWDVFSNLHHNDRDTLKTYWASVPEFQEALTVYLKTRIDAGVVNGETSLPLNLIWYEFVWSFPEALREDLYEHARYVLESSPDNGAAAKFAAIVLAGIPWDIPRDGFWDVVEKAMLLLPNDVEVCYLAFEKAGLIISTKKPSPHSKDSLRGIKHIKHPLRHLLSNGACRKAENLLYHNGYTVSVMITNM